MQNAKLFFNICKSYMKVKHWLLLFRLLVYKATVEPNNYIDLGIDFSKAFYINKINKPQTPKRPSELCIPDLAFPGCVKDHAFSSTIMP